MATTWDYPVRVDGAPPEGLSRWLWLVKWILAIPHYLILSLLWVVFVVLTVVAFFWILVDGHYPRSIFDFNVGVLRWTWRVQYYSYGALATDRYPPFTLGEVPDYPARLSVPYPEHLSRGLVLVKWWLLAIPQYLVVSLFVGGGVNWPNTGLIGLLALVAAIMVAFTSEYPASLFDLIMGLNRWVLRVVAYAALMTDAYPPFRLDLGAAEPSGPPEPRLGGKGGSPVPPPAGVV